MKRMIFITGRIYQSNQTSPFEYWINADHISYVIGRKSSTKGCQIKIIDRESLIETDESFNDVMAKIYSV